MGNTITLSLDKYPSDDEYEQNLESSNLVFTLIFAFEMVVKLFGLGLKDYLRDSFNIFDGSIVLLSLIDLILSSLGTGSGGGFAAVSAFRSLRLFRIFKLAR